VFDLDVDVESSITGLMAPEEMRSRVNVGEFMQENMLHGENLQGILEKDIMVKRGAQGYGVSRKRRAFRMDETVYKTCPFYNNGGCDRYDQVCTGRLCTYFRVHYERVVHYKERQEE